MFTSSSKLHLPDLSMCPPPKVLPIETEDMLIGALLRVPAQAIHRRIIRELNAAGFDELRLPHMAVLQFPGPDGVRPGMLAERAGMSKQAINQLLRSLEGFGYIVRSDVPGEGGARVVRAYQTRTRRILKNHRDTARHRARVEHRTRTEALCSAEERC